jgi:hypothetical protein
VGALNAINGVTSEGRTLHRPAVDDSVGKERAWSGRCWRGYAVRWFMVWRSTDGGIDEYSKQQQRLVLSQGRRKREKEERWLARWAKMVGCTSIWTGLQH